MSGIEIVEGDITRLDVDAIVNAANDSTIRLAPALTIGDVEIDEFIDLFTRALTSVQDALPTETHTEPATPSEATT